MKDKTFLLFKLMITTLITVLLTGCAVVPQEESAPTQPKRSVLEVTVLKSGQADAILILSEYGVVLIDTGEKDDGDEIVDYLRSANKDEIDCMIITHFDKDHIGGVPEVLQNIPVKQVIQPDYEGSGDHYSKYLSSLQEHQIQPDTLTEQVDFTMGDAEFSVIPPGQTNAQIRTDNDFSLVVSLLHGENSFLFTGDAQDLRISELLKAGLQQYDYLKVPYHGKSLPINRMFYDTVKPKIAVITCSEKNPEEKDTVQLLEKAGAKVYLTRNGNVVCKSDGIDLTVTQ